MGCTPDNQFRNGLSAGREQNARKKLMRSRRVVGFGYFGNGLSRVGPKPSESSGPAPHTHLRDRQSYRTPSSAPTRLFCPNISTLGARLEFRTTHAIPSIFELTYL